MMKPRVLAVVMAVALLPAACDNSPTATEVGSSTTPGAPVTTSEATITITTSGVSPSTVAIGVGGRVTFVNNDTVSHDMSSNPHPSHTDCPPLNTVGTLRPGQSGQTGPFPTARTCGFHDHDDPLATRLQGTITIR